MTFAKPAFVTHCKCRRLQQPYASQVSPAPIETFPGLTGDVMPWDARDCAQLDTQLRLRLSTSPQYYQQKHRPKQDGFYVQITVM